MEQIAKGLWLGMLLWSSSTAKKVDRCNNSARNYASIPAEGKKKESGGEWGFLAIYHVKIATSNARWRGYPSVAEIGSIRSTISYFYYSDKDLKEKNGGNGAFLDFLNLQKWPKLVEVAWITQK